jgi:ribonuclease T
MSIQPAECFISVDVETAGPIPGEYSLLSIGACLVEDDRQAFECLLKPTTRHADPKALEVCGLSLDTLELDGLVPAEAMSGFASWVAKVANGRSPVFVGLNAGFDWSFVNYYFHRYHSGNPFGFAPLDIKALFMGTTGCTWRDTRSSNIAKIIHPTRTANHNALDDAIAQAEMFRLIRGLTRHH